MILKERYTYGRADKLKSRKAIKELFEKGFKFSHQPFRVFCRQTTPDIILEAGIGVSSRLIRKAHQRNRVKRLMREAYRLQCNELRNDLVNSKKGIQVFILFQGKDIPSYPEVYEGIGKIISRLIRLSNENFKTLV